MTELVTFGETMLRMTPTTGDRLETARRLDFRTAGAESNVAIAASRLGVDTVWTSKLPDSPLGRRVRNDVRTHGVTPEIVWSQEGRQGVYYIEHGGQPRGTEVVYDRDGAAVTTATPEELPTDLIDDSAVFFTTGITPALSETLFETTRRLVETDATVGFDLNYRKKLWEPAAARKAFETLFPSVDLLFAPERDVRTVLGIDGEPTTVADRLRDRYDCDTVVLTRGSDGAVGSTAAETVSQPAIEAETVDPIGTGDAFAGAFISQYIEGESLRTCLEWGAAAAALKRTLEGDWAVITESEVAAVLDRDTRRPDR